MNTTALHTRINIRQQLQTAMTQKGIRNYGGENNATVNSSGFKFGIAMRANTLVLGFKWPK